MLSSRLLAVISRLIVTAIFAEKVRLSDQCFVDSGGGGDGAMPVAECLTIAQVASQPRLKVTFKQTVLDSVGQKLSLQCVAAGHPTPTVTWYLDGHPIEENQHHVVYGDYVK